MPVSARAVPEGDRRGSASALAREIARELRERAGRDGTAQLVVRIGGGRVQLLLRSERGRTHVVALCAPALRERVERALARARFALAARGLRAEAA